MIREKLRAFWTEMNAGSSGPLVALLGVSISGTLSIVVFDPGWIVRLVIGLPLLFLVPGYVTTIALCPTGSRGTIDSEVHRPSDITSGAINHTLLSLGLSLAIVPLLARVLVATPGEFSGQRLLITVEAFVVVVGLIAIGRRRTAVDESPKKTHPALDESITQIRTRWTKATLILLTISILFAAGSVSLAVAGPSDRGSYAELYLLTENDSGGLQATDYPQNYTVDEPRSLVVVIENQQKTTTNYTVVAQLQRVDEETGTVTERERLGEFSPRLAADTKFQRSHQVRPTMTGEQLRLTYLLYRGSAPENPTIENATQSVHLWVTVAETGERVDGSLSQ